MTAIFIVEFKAWKDQEEKGSKSFQNRLEKAKKCALPQFHGQIVNTTNISNGQKFN